MKLKLIPIALIFSTITASAQIGTPNYLDQTGFNGIHLGDTITKMPKDQLAMISTGANGRSVIYTYNNANALKLTDNVTLQKVEIEYFRNKVMAIDLYFNKTDLPAIQTYFDKIYGKGEDAEYYLSEYSAPHSQLNLHGNTKNDGYKAVLSWPDE